jgi:hypothetical protein
LVVVPKDDAAPKPLEEAAAPNAGALVAVAAPIAGALVAAAAPKTLVDAAADEAGELDAAGAPNAGVLVDEAAPKTLVVAAADDAGLVVAPNALEAPKEGALVAAEATVDADAGVELDEPKPKEPSPADMLVVDAAAADEDAFAAVDEIPNAGFGSVSSLDGARGCDSKLRNRSRGRCEIKRFRCRATRWWSTRWWRRLLEVLF